MDKPPKKGKSLDIEHLVSLGIPENIADKLVKYWLERGITNLYAFQEKAIKYGISGKNLVIDQLGLEKQRHSLFPQW